MTVEEIKATLHTQLSDRAWLREIALQLAVLNEQGVAETVAEALPPVVEVVKRGPGRPPKVKNV